MNKKVKIKLMNFDQMKRYAQEVIKFCSDVNIIKGAVVYDGKSIMAVLALGTLDDIYVEILSEDEDEIKEFNEVMKEFE